MSKTPTSYQLRLIELPGVTEPALYEAGTDYDEARAEALALSVIADHPTIVEVLETRRRTWFGPTTVSRPRR